jgi:serine/threonine-protein kinase
VEPSVAAAIMVGALRGLHAAHEATSCGEPLGIVHRDVSPQNVLVDKNGATRIVDFGIAKAIGRLVETTVHGHIKGKLPYMAPEQMRPGMVVTRRADVFGVGVVLWEALVGRRLFGEGDVSRAASSSSAVRPPSALAPAVPTALDEVVLRALATHPRDRFATAEEMAEAIEGAVRVASPAEVAEWVERVAGEELREHARRVAMIEAGEDRPPASAAPAIVAPSPTKHAPKRSLLGAVIGVAVVGAAVAAIVSNRAPREEPIVAQAPPSPPPISSSEPIVAPPPPSPEPSVAATIEPAPIAAAPPSRVREDAPPAAREPSKKRTPPRRRAADPRGCATRFEIVDGIKVFKPECLR